MTVVNFRTAEDRRADQMADEMWSFVAGHDTALGIHACIETLAMLIAGYGMQHGDTAGLADRTGKFLAQRAVELGAEAERARAEQAPEATA